MKTCKKCLLLKPLEEFYRANGTRDGRRGDCKDCFRQRTNARNAANPEANRRRARQWEIDNPERVRARAARKRQRPEIKRYHREDHLRRTFGMTLADYERMLADQHGVCAVCARPPKEGRTLHVDHDHGTRRIRGLLCGPCNHGLGLLQDDPEVIASALAYLGASKRIDALKALR